MNSFILSNRFLILKFGLLAILALIPGYYLFRQDSYWFDEVFSLSIVRESISTIVQEWLPYDAHPPLYTAILWMWVRIFGYSETATRALSYLFYLGAIISYSWYFRKIKLLPFLLGSLGLFQYAAAYFSLEVRAYSMMFFLTTLYFSRYYSVNKLDTKGKWILAMIALGHLFGTLLSGVILLLVWLNALKNDPSAWFKKTLFLLWPIIPALVFLGWLFLFGNLANLSGGKFWIQTDTWSAIKSMFKVFLPISDIFRGFLIYPAGILFTFFLIYLCWQYYDSFIGKTLSIFFVSMGLLLSINLHSPLIVDRYLLMFVPLVIIPLIIYLQGLPLPVNVNRVGFVACLFIFLISLKWTHFNVKNRAYSRDNIKAQADYIYNSEYPVYHLFTESKKYFTDYMLNNISQFYLWKDYGVKTFIPSIQIGELTSIPKPFLLQVVHDFDQGAAKTIRAAGFKKLEWINFMNGGGASYCVKVLE